MPTELAECERVAYVDGLAAGLTRALAGIDVVKAAPGRLAPVATDHVRPRWAVVDHRLAAAERITFVRREGADERSDRSTSVGPRLAAARLGVTRRLLAHAITHLSGRFSGGEPLLRKQLVTGEIADVLADIDTARSYAVIIASRAALSGAAVRDLHERISATDWRLTMLFGASGYIAEHPVRALYVSALVANCWIDGPEAQ